MQHKELVLGDEVLAALCVVVRFLHVFDVCRATAHCSKVRNWDCGRYERRPLAIVHSRCLVMVATSSCPGDGQHTLPGFSCLCFDCTTRLKLALRDVV